MQQTEPEKLSVGQERSRERPKWGSHGTNPSLLRLWLVLCFDLYSGLFWAWGTVQDSKGTSSQMKKTELELWFGCSRIWARLDKALVTQVKSREERDCRFGVERTVEKRH